MTKYLLDANVFIQARNREYGFDICPGFWDWLVEKNKSGLVASIKKVAEEIKKDNDLVMWVKKRGHSFFLDEDDKMITSFRTVNNWVKNAGYEDYQLKKFLDGADFYLIAYALGHDYSVVTHETFHKGNGKIKIPNVCKGLGLPCMNPYEMLRKEQARFVMESSHYESL